MMKMRDVLDSAFGKGGEAFTIVAPGRVNLIGEHTDYNGGFVLPMAIDFGIEMAFRRRADRQVRLFSADYKQATTFSLDAPIARDDKASWSNYSRGVFSELQRAGLKVGGLDLAFGGDLPQGGGLSSSAALEVATARAAQKLYGFELSGPQIALLCQRAENEFVGMKCGIMDQFVIQMALRQHALFLDCRSLDFEHIPLELGEHVVLVVNSGVKHSLVGSEYNVRREQCEAGVRVLGARRPGVKALRDATLRDLEAAKASLDPVVYRRCRHVITEDDRVLASVEALHKGDLRSFGAHMNASHDSLRDDYEVSCKELDLLVDLARKVPGVLGARMTGGGFGGCTVNLVGRSSVETFQKEVVEEYFRRTNIKAKLLASTPADGAHLVDAGGF